MYPGRILSFDKLPIRTHGTLPRPSYWSGERYFCRKCTILQCKLLRDCPLSSHCGQIRLHTPPQKEFCIFILFLFFFGCIKNASYYSFSRHKRLNLPNSPHIFCMEAHGSHSYPLWFTPAFHEEILLFVNCYEIPGLKIYLLHFYCFSIKMQV